jgi:hypothetical protein
VAAQDIGSLGPREGEPVTIHCPIPDALRSVYLWFVLFLLLLRKPNRTRHAWAVLIPLLAVYLILFAAERRLNAYFIFYYHQYMCSSICDLLRFSALSLAILLSVSDLVAVRNRLLRFLLVFLILLITGGVATLPNAWPMLTPFAWAVWFGVFLLIFLVGHSIARALLRRLFGLDWFEWLYMGFCLLFGIGPMAILGVVESAVSHSNSVQIRELLRVAIILSAAISPPYFVLFCFVVLARLSPFYRRRFARCFGPRTAQDLAEDQG